MVKVEAITVTDNGARGVSADSAEVVDSYILQNSDDGIYCDGTATIRHSEIVGNGGAAIAAKRINLRDTKVHSNDVGVSAFRRATVANCEITSNDNFGIRADRLRLESSQVVGNWVGVFALGGKVSISNSVLDQNLFMGVYTFGDDQFGHIFGHTDISDSSVSNNGGAGIDATTVTVSNSVVNGNNGNGVQAIRANIAATEVIGNAFDGVFTRNQYTGFRRMYVAKNVISDCTVTGNGRDGVESTKHMRVLRSTVTGNRLDAQCGDTLTCADIKSESQPLVDASICETSYSVGDGNDWDVCSLDP